MNRHRPGSMRRSLLATLLLGTVAASIVVGPVRSSSAAPVHDVSVGTDAAPPAGTDLWHLDSATGHYTQAASGLTDLQLYNSPVGIPDATGWHLRDTTLGSPAADGTVAPANLPFALHIATSSGGSTLAALTNEDGVSLGVGLAAINGATPANVTGQVGDSAVTYTAPVASSPSDVAVRATISGVDLQLTLHNANESGHVTLSLAPDPRTSISQDAGGAIRITRPITDYGGSGATHPGVTIQPEYVIESPLAVDSNTDVAAPVRTGLVSTSLVPAASGRQNLAVSVDSTWLHDVHRVFPVRLDVPIVTAYSVVNTGWFGTVNSCAAAVPAPQTDMVVGSAAGCTYQGLASFDTTSLLYDTPIGSAVLHLYTPDQAGATGVQVLPNTSQSTTLVRHPDPAEQPSWTTAPTTLPSASGSAQSGSTGQWQSWDVTALVRQWVQNPRSNGGVTLVSSGSPVRFAAALGLGQHSPALAPYLEITYGPRPAVSRAYDDGARSVMGISGTFAACNTVQCAPAGPISVYASGPLGVAGNYIRVGAVMDCSGGMPTAASGNGDTLYNILYGSSYSAFREGLIPIVNFVPNNNCDGLAPSLWNQGVKTFVANMGYPTTSWIYFEIGNEPNTTAGDPSHGGCNTAYGQYPNCNAQGFEDTFAAAAQGLRDAMGDSRTTYRILTGAMAQPTGYVSFQGSCTDLHGNIDVNDAANAITEAEGAPYSVNASHLGAGAHPYSYTTDETSSYWRNYFHEYPGSSGDRGYVGVCGDIGHMISLWTSDFPGLPVIFTEDNWTDHPTTPLHTAHCGNYIGCAGTYLVDLRAWLHGHPAGSHYDDPSNSPIRVIWFTGINFTGPPPTNEAFPLGLYDKNGNVQPFNTGYCPDNSDVAGYQNLSDDYRNLIYFGTCY